MMEFFQRHRARLLALAILGLVVATLWLVVVQPIAGAFAAQSDAMAQSQTRIGAYQAEIASQKDYEAELALVNAQQTGSAGLVSGKNSALAAANMQNLVSLLVESEQGQVRSAQNLPATAVDGFERIAIQYDVSLPTKNLRETAYRLETQTPYLFLDNVDIRMPETWQSEGAASDPPNLEIRWTVHAFRAVQKS